MDPLINFPLSDFFSRRFARCQTWISNIGNYVASILVVTFELYILFTETNREMEGNFN